MSEISTNISYSIEADRDQGYARVDTYGFQAEKFYHKHGFNVIAVVPKYLRGYDKIFLKKSL